MNLIERIRDGLAGPAPFAPSVTPPAEAAGLPRFCPECGSGNASEATEHDRRSTRLTCPDCGLTERTELLR